MRLNDLFESTNMSAAETVAAFKRDPAVAPIFKRNSTDIDPVALKAAFVRYILSNQTLRQWMRQHSIYYPFGKRWVNGEISKYDITNMVDVFKQVARKATSSAKGRLSANTLNELVDWVGANGPRRFLSDSAQWELMATPGIRPDKPVKLYRGMMFRDSAFNKGEDDSRSPAAIQRAIREGKTKLKFTHPNPSSWTPGTGTAEKFARFSSANSNFEAMFAALHRGRTKQFIDGSLGVILATYARPEDILCDLSMIDFGNRHLQYQEPELLLRPGTILCKIEHAYNKDGPIALGVTQAETPAENLIKGITKAANMINLQFNSDDAPKPNYQTYYYDEDCIRQALERGPAIFARGQEIVDTLKPVIDTLGDRRLDPAQVSPEQQPKFKALSDLIRIVRVGSSEETFEKSMMSYHAGRGRRGFDILDTNRSRLFAASVFMKTGKYPSYRERVPIYKTMKPETQEKHLGEVVNALLTAGGRDISQPWSVKIKDLSQLIRYTRAVTETYGSIAEMIECLRTIEE